jgi:hypothetical protein
MSSKIGDAPNGQNTSLQGTEKLPITGSKWTYTAQVSKIPHTHADSDNGGVVNHTALTNAGTSLHVPTYSSDSTTFLNGKGEWTTPAGTGNIYDSDIIFQDITTGNADSDSHGFLLKLSMSTSNFLRADGTWQAPPASGSVYDSDILFSDTIANNSTTSQHGFLPKLSGDSTEYLNGDGEWITPAVGSGRTLIAENTPTGTGTTTFSSIPGGHKKLILEFAIRSTQAVNAVDGKVQYNGDTTAGNYHYSETHRNNSGFGSASGGTNIIFGASGVPGSSAPANSFAIGVVEIPQYANTNFYKMTIVDFVMDYDVTSVYAQHFNQGVRWANTAAITQIDIVLSAGNFATNSVLRLYYED